jgi:hypothetical protein
LNHTDPKQKLSSGDCKQSENDSDEIDVCYFSLDILMWLMEDEENSADDWQKTPAPPDGPPRNEPKPANQSNIVRLTTQFPSELQTNDQVSVSAFMESTHCDRRKISEIIAVLSALNIVTVLPEKIVGLRLFEDASGRRSIERFSLRILTSSMRLSRRSCRLIFRFAQARSPDGNRGADPAPSSEFELMGAFALSSWAPQDSRGVPRRASANPHRPRMVSVGRDAASGGLTAAPSPSL